MYRVGDKPTKTLVVGDATGFIGPQNVQNQRSANQTSRSRSYRARGPTECTKIK